MVSSFVFDPVMWVPDFCTFLFCWEHKLNVRELLFISSISIISFGCSGKKCSLNRQRSLGEWSGLLNYVCWVGIMPPAILLLQNTFVTCTNQPTAVTFFLPFPVCTEEMFSLCSLLIFPAFFFVSSSSFYARQSGGFFFPYAN